MPTSSSISTAGSGTKQHATTGAILDGLQDRIEILISPETHNEINRNVDALERALSAGYRKQLPSPSRAPR